MLSRLRVSVSFGQSEVDDVNHIFLVSSACHEVVGFDVSMYEPFPVDLFQSGDGLDANIERSREGKPFVAESDSQYHFWKSSSRERPRSSMTRKTLSKSGSVP